MKAVFEQPIEVTAAQAQAAFVDPTFYARLGALPHISAPEVRTLARDGDNVHMVLGYHFDGQLAGPARRFLDPARISWSQQADVDLASKLTEVRMVPDNYKSLLSFSGWYRLDDEGPERCSQHFEAELHVHIPLVGALAERAIASGIKENLAATAKLLEAHVKGGP